jgi:hypothetical protein
VDLPRSRGEERRPEEITVKIVKATAQAKHGALASSLLQGWRRTSGRARIRTCNLLIRQLELTQSYQICGNGRIPKDGWIGYERIKTISTELTLESLNP